MLRQRLKRDEWGWRREGEETPQLVGGPPRSVTKMELDCDRFLGRKTLVKNGGRKPEKEEELSDHTAGLTPLREKGKEGTLSRKKNSLGLQWKCQKTLARLMGSSFFFSFLVRKTDPELTSVTNIPLFCWRKIDPELTSVPIFLYFVCGMPPRHGLMSGV